MVTPTKDIRLPSTIRMKGQCWREYEEIIPANVAYEQAISGDYWRNAARYLSPFDVIRCVSETGAFDVEIRVTRKSHLGLTFAVVRGGEVDIEIRPEVPFDKYVVQSRGSSWALVEKATGNVLLACPLKEDADREWERLMSLETA